MDCNWIGWCALGANGQAAWVQAIGSLVAIAVAIGVPALQHCLAVRREKRSSALRARALGLAVMADLEIVGDRLNDVWGHEHPDELPDVKGHPNSKELGEKTLAALEIPERLDSRIATLHEMGPAADAALRCLHHLIRAREYVTKVNEFQITFDAARFYDLLWEATRQNAFALNRIDALFPTLARPKNQKTPT